MSMDETVVAIAPLSGYPPSWVRSSIQKAWAGREPVVKDAEGRITLNLESRHTRRTLVRVGLVAPSPRTPPKYNSSVSDVPLTMDALKACFWRGCPSGVSDTRLAAAVLDVVDRGMYPIEIGIRRVVVGGACSISPVEPLPVEAEPRRVGRRRTSPARPVSGGRTPGDAPEDPRTGDPEA